MSEEEAWEGYPERECGDHRTVVYRAWCFDDREWCYDNMPCRGCELPALRTQAERFSDALRLADSTLAWCEGRFDAEGLPGHLLNTREVIRHALNAHTPSPDSHTPSGSSPAHDADDGDDTGKDRDEPGDD